MDNTQSKDRQSFDDAMRKIWGPTWGKYRNMTGKDDFQRKTAPDMNKGQASKELQSKIAALKNFFILLLSPRKIAPPRNWSGLCFLGPRGPHGIPSLVRPSVR